MTLTWIGCSLLRPTHTRLGWLRWQQPDIPLIDMSPDDVSTAGESPGTRAGHDDAVALRLLGSHWLRCD